MKTPKLLLLFIITLPFSIYSQDYKKFIKENASWRVYQNIIQFPDTTIYDEIWENYFAGDTLVQGVSYHKMYKHLLSSINNDYHAPYTRIGNKTLDALVREDTISKKVFALFVSDRGYCTPNEEHLLYDFSLSPGDEYKEQCNLGFSYSTMDEIKPDPNYPSHRAFYSEEGDYHKVYTEGIGAPTGPIEYISSVEGTVFVLDQYCVGQNCALTTSVEENGLTSFSNYPNPFVEYTRLTNPKSIQSIQVTSLGGQSINFGFNNKNGELNIIADKGIYFVTISTHHNKQYTIRIVKL